MTQLPGKVPMLFGIVFAAATRAEAVHVLQDRLLATFIGSSFAPALARDITGALHSREDLAQ